MQRLWNRHDEAGLLPVLRSPMCPTTLTLQGHVQLLDCRDVTVIAGARFPEKAQSLQDLRKRYQQRLHLLTLDVTDQQSVKVSMRQGLNGNDCDELLQSALMLEAVSDQFELEFHPGPF